MPASEFSTIVDDPAVGSVLRRLYLADTDYDWESEERDGFDDDPFKHAGVGFSLFPAQGDFLYTLARYGRPKVVVEFATSLGFSALYLGAALKRNGEGHVYGSELVPAKVEQARANLEEADLGSWATVLEGDARRTLAGLPEPIDLCLIDGWPGDPDQPSLALEVLRILEPQLRPGALVVNDNAEPDYLDYIRASDRFASFTLPWKGATEVSLYS